MTHARQRLVKHVLEVQERIRSCTGCGLCCTEAFNSVEILPVEAQRIARHLRSREPRVGHELEQRLADTVKRYALDQPARGKKRHYTCAFLEKDLTCALPFDVKPVACLSFNPIHEERCEGETEWFERAHRGVEEDNRAAGHEERRRPIPVAVLEALKTSAHAGRKSADAGHAALHDPRAPRPARMYLPRWLSKSLHASRKSAEQMVFDGRVRVNGVVQNSVLFEIRPGIDRVLVDGSAVEEPTGRGFAWWLVNKPRGVVTSTADEHGRKTVLALIDDPESKQLSPVGRLDKDSAGLLLITNDHELAAALTNPRSHVPKLYRVKVRGQPSAECLECLRTQTVRFDDLVLGPFETVTIEKTAEKSCWLRITLREGKNRQIRRRMEAQGHPVEVLVRIGFGPLHLGDLAPGVARRLEPGEVAALRRAIQQRPGVTPNAQTRSATKHSPRRRP